MFFCIKGEKLSPLASLLAEGRILAAGENLKGLEKLYLPILKTLADKLGGERLVLYFNEEKISEIEAAALSEIHGAHEECLVPLRTEAKGEGVAENLMLIDSRMSEFLAAMEVEHERTGEQRAEVLLQSVAEKNSLHFSRPDFYDYKWKQYLLSAFGRSPCGGYVNVWKRGERLDFYIYDREHFAVYLTAHAYWKRQGTCCIVK